MANEINRELKNYYGEISKVLICSGREKREIIVTIQSPSRFSGIRYKSHRVTELTHRKYNDYKSIFCIKSLKNNKIIVTFRGD